MPGDFPTLLVDREKGRPVRQLELRAEDGRLLGQCRYRAEAESQG